MRRSLKLVVILAPLLGAAQCQTRDNACADALERYARSLDAFKEDRARVHKETREDMRAVTGALNARAEADEAQARVLNRYADEMAQMRCIPMTPLPRPQPGAIE